MDLAILEEMIQQGESDTLEFKNSISFLVYIRLNE